MNRLFWFSPWKILPERIFLCIDVGGRPQVQDQGCSPKTEVSGRHKNLQGHKKYVKRTQWIISYNKVWGRRTPPSTPDYIPVI